MKGLIQALKRIKEDRMLGSAGAEALQRFVGDQFTAQFSFVSSTRTFSLRHDSSYNSGYTVTCKPEGEEIDVTVLFRPAEDKMVESLSADEVFESEVSFVEFDSLYQRAVFTGAGTQNVLGDVSDDAAVTEVEKVEVLESHEPAIEVEAKPEPEPEKTTKEVVKVPAKRQTTLTSQRCTLEIDGRVKEASQESISSIIEKLKSAENYWVFKPGSQYSWRRELIRYTRQTLSVNEDEPAKRAHSFEHWKSKSWKEKSIISPEDACEKMRALLEENQFETEHPFKGPRESGLKVEVDWSSPVKQSSDSVEEVIQSLSGAKECWVITNGSDELGYNEFIQYLYDEEEGIGTYEKWREGSPVQREQTSPEEAIQKARNYLDSKELVTPSYLAHFSGELKQKQPVSRGRGRGSSQSPTGVGINGLGCGCFAFSLFFGFALFLTDAKGIGIVVILIGIFVGRLMTSQRKA
ncbi:MAG: hypothetical protein ABGZ19_14040 [Verrucomicrobiales bacterium]